MKTPLAVKAYEESEFLRAFKGGTDKDWKRYRINVKRAVTRYNNKYGKQNGEILLEKIMS